jgi:hypothetical protein
MSNAKPNKDGFIGVVRDAQEQDEQDAEIIVTTIARHVRIFWAVSAGIVGRPIRRAPGFGLHGFLTSIVPKSFSERVLDPLLADSIELYFEKLDSGDRWGAWRVRWAMRGWLLWSVFGGALAAVFAALRGKRQPSE